MCVCKRPSEGVSVTKKRISNKALVSNIFHFLKINHLLKISVFFLKNSRRGKNKWGWDNDKMNWMKEIKSVERKKEWMKRWICWKWLRMLKSTPLKLNCRYKLCETKIQRAHLFSHVCFHPTDSVHFPKKPKNKITMLKEISSVFCLISLHQPYFYRHHYLQVRILFLGS